MAAPILFTHVVNAFVAKPGTEHDRAQRITFASMANAIAFAADKGIGAEVVTVVRPMDVAAPPPFAKTVPALERTVLDVGTFKKAKPLPLLGDILTAGAAAGTGEYLIYSNVDIGLQPHFYTELAGIIAANGPGRALVVNRRTVADHYKGPEDLPAIYQDPGQSHIGWDCFIFPRAWIPSMHFGLVCVGAFWFDNLLIANVDLMSRRRLIILKNMFITFHVGDPATWGDRVFSDYDEHNRKQCVEMIQLMRKEHGGPRFGSYFDWLEKKVRGGKRVKYRRALLEARRLLHVTRLAIRARHLRWS